ncbi:MAG: hypothetical protein IPM64_17635 [Phycisphaerales bacterium]|nr:hypothetical protein [Phycisphaerales bacterium]
MTVTELREALQKLESEGHGDVRVLDSFWLKPADPRIAVVEASYSTPAFPTGSVVVML